MDALRVVDHTKSPGGRFVRDGEFSGEWFRENYLRPALSKAIGLNERLAVVLDGTDGYSSSFLEEAFGGLIRSGVFSLKQVQESLEIISNNPVYLPYRDLARRYIADASRVAQMNAA